MDEGGFKSVTRLAEARDRLREHCGGHGRTETVPLPEAVGRVVAAPLEADRAVPHYDRAAMDGYAVRASHTFAAGDGSPARLSLASDRVDRREAVQVHTGSAVPDGADAVVMVERTEQRDGELLVHDPVAEGENVAPAGEDVEAGQPLFDPGRRLTASDVALLRATGVEAVTVAARPRVSVLPTGEELVPPGTEPGPGEVVETNGLLVATLAEQWGATASHRDVVTDDEDALRAAIADDTDHDLVVTTGGSSVGGRDLVPDVVADLGELVVHGVAIKPGHPVGFGVVEDTPVLVLPGYPVSCLVNAVQFLRPAVAWQAGTTPRTHPAVHGELREKLPSAPGERTFARVRIVGGGDPPEGDGDPPDVEPIQTSGAGVLSSVTAADGWVEIPESREGIPAGETVRVQQWEPDA
jgi:molybdopterin molybdotransferase